MADCGWRLSLIEQRLLVTVPGQHQPAAVRPDVIVTHDSDAVLVCECKFGTVQEPQLANYRRLDTSQISEGTHLMATSHQVCYFGVAEHVEGCKLSLDGTSIPLIVFSDDAARLVAHELDEPCLHSKFSVGIDLTNARPPTFFLPLDTESTLTDTLPEVIRALIQFGIDQREIFHPTDIVEELFDEAWGSIPNNYRRELERPVLNALNHLARMDVMGDIVKAGAGNAFSLQPDFGHAGGVRYATSVRRMQRFQRDQHEQLAMEL
jgi:hypothetical protein